MYEDVIIRAIFLDLKNNKIQILFLVTYKPKNRKLAFLDLKNCCFSLYIFTKSQSLFI